VTLVFRRADHRDADAIGDMYEETVKWLADKGTDQWQPDAMEARGRVHAGKRGLDLAISRGEAWIVESAGTAVGTFVLDAYADPEFWYESDKPEQALYLHRMVVSRAASGAGIGAQILAWAGSEAARRGRLYLRLDAWRTNKKLHAYYLLQGFELIRIVTKPHRGSGALFQRSAAP
jgi:GNAT superfamily N-acetyltransferase